MENNKQLREFIKEMVGKMLSEELNEIPDDYQDFDDFEFHTSAKDVAKDDIEKEFGLGSFEDIGKNKFEKGMKSDEFSDKVKRANLRLKSDEEEIEKISNDIKKTKGEKDKLEKIAYKMDAPSFSLNENKRSQVLAGILKNNNKL